MGPIERFMMEDHLRVDDLLAAATSGPDPDAFAYARFRREMLRHIAMEEEVLLPDAASRRRGAPLEIAERLRADHEGITKLLQRSPTNALVDDLRHAIAEHNVLEEGPRGLYATCDALAGEQANAVVERLRALPRPAPSRPRAGARDPHSASRSDASEG